MVETEFDDYQEDVLLELRGISKAFPGCLANDQIDLTLQKSRVHALLGQNGAGKSTLVKIIYGVLQADAGETLWCGESVVIRNPAMARELGIAMVFQHFSLFDSLTVLENISLGLQQRPAISESGPANVGQLSNDELRKKTIEVSANYGLALDPDRHVYTLSVGERQRIEIVRCLLQNPRLLIMDEPTSVLTPQEVEGLFDTLERLKNEGLSILYISHKLDEIRRLCSQASILRNGKLVANTDPRRESSETLAALMIGEELAKPRAKASAVHGEVRLSVRDLGASASNRQTSQTGTRLSNVSFDVRAGEIVGIAGVAGNGQDELLDALSGERRQAQGGSILIDAVPIATLAPDQRRRHGLCCVPEERLGHAAVPAFSLAENALLTAFHRMGLAPHGWINRDLCNRFTDSIIEKFDVHCNGAKSSADSLSGGNLQKFIVGREIMQTPGVLVVSQPTWGVDAGAASAIHTALRELAAAGSAILVISQDLDELLLLCHNLMAICAGRVSEAYPAGDISAAEIGLLMGGKTLQHSSGSAHFV